MTPAALALDTIHRSQPTRVRDGSVVRLRPVQAADEDTLRAFMEGVSPDSLYARFFGVPNIRRAASWLATSSSRGDYGLVAETASGTSIVAHAGWFRIGEDRAEAAFLVTDRRQRRGLARIMLSRLVAAAQARDIATLVAEVLPGNHSMAAVFERSGQPVKIWTRDDIVRVSLGTAPAPALLRLAAQDTIQLR